MRCPAFESLIKDMKKNEIDKEHYSFVYKRYFASSSHRIKTHSDFTRIIYR